MLLENKFYKVLSSERVSDLEAKFCLAILPECDVYEGHFPGEPVCPGVCNIQTIKECAMMLTGEKLTYTSIKQCRLTALATPEISPEVTVSVSLTLKGEGFAIQASVLDDKQTYMILKGQLDRV